MPGQHSTRPARLAAQGEGWDVAGKVLSGAVPVFIVLAVLIGAFAASTCESGLACSQAWGQGALGRQAIAAVPLQLSPAFLLVVLRFIKVQLNSDESRGA